MFDEDYDTSFDDDLAWGIPIGIVLALVLWIVGGHFGVFPW